MLCGGWGRRRLALLFSFGRGGGYGRNPGGVCLFWGRGGGGLNVLHVWWLGTPSGLRSPVLRLGGVAAMVETQVVCFVLGPRGGLNVPCGGWGRHDLRSCSRLGEGVAAMVETLGVYVCFGMRGA